MPRLKRPTSLVGAAQVLNDVLHDLHARAGLPSLSDLVRMIGGRGVVSRSRVYEAFTGERVPDWGLLELLVEQLASKVPGGPSPQDEVRRFHKLWLAAAGQPETDPTEHKSPTTRIHALVVIAEWVNAPLLPFPATRHLQQLVDAALTNSGATEFLINRRNSTDGSLLILHVESRPYAAIMAVLVAAFDTLLAADRRDNDYRRRPYPQVRLLAHAGEVESDGQDYSGQVLLTLREHNESMTIRDALVGDDDTTVIAIASDEVFDPDLPDVAGSRWIPVVNTPDGSAPLRWWIRAPAPGSTPDNQLGSSTPSTTSASTGPADKGSSHAGAHNPHGRLYGGGAICTPTVDDEIIVDMRDKDGRGWEEAFRGRWLIEPDDTNRFGSDAGACYGIAQTAKGKIVVYVYHVNDRWPPHLEFYSDLDEVQNDLRLANEAIAAAASAMGERRVIRRDI